MEFTTKSIRKSLGEDDVSTRCGSVFTNSTTTSSMVWSVLVVVTFVIQVISNVLSGFGAFNNATNGRLSDENPTYITPDGLTFSVWGIIYTFQAIFTIYQVVPQVQNSHEPLTNARVWVVLLYLLNAVWLPAFSFSLWWLAFLIIASMYGSLIMIYYHLGINYGPMYHGTSPTRSFALLCSPDKEESGTSVTETDQYWFVKVFMYVGFSTNLSWITVATLLNFLVATRNSGWYTSCPAEISNGIASAMMINVGGNPDFAVMVCVAIALIASFLVVRFGDVPYALVAMWALGGINRMQTVPNEQRFPISGQSQQLASWSLAMIIVVACATAIGLVKILWQSRKHLCFGTCFQIDNRAITKRDINLEQKHPEV